MHSILVKDRGPYEGTSRPRTVLVLASLQDGTERDDFQTKRTGTGRDKDGLAISDNFFKNSSINSKKISPIAPDAKKYSRLKFNGNHTSHGLQKLPRF